MELDSGEPVDEHSLHFENVEDKARFLAVQRPESGAWLHALPSESIDTLLNNNAFRIIIGLRLGMFTSRDATS